MTGMEKERSAAYGDQVCQFVRHATKKEKAAIRKELTDHIADHTQALMDAGHPPEAAQALALEAMGEPEAVGKALNKEYPLRWLVLSRLAPVAVLLLALALLYYGWYTPFLLKDYLAARSGPIQTQHTVVFNSDTGQSRQVPNLTLLDLRYQLPNQNILFLYAVGLEATGERYTAYLYTVQYSRHPARLDIRQDQELTFPMQEAGTLDSSLNWGLAIYSWYTIPLSSEEPLIARYDHYGTRIDTEIPLPWEEVLP